MITPKKKSEFEAFYEEFWPKIYSFVYYRVQNEQEAEELTQEVFHKVYKQMSRKKQIENMRAYIYMTARNIVYDLWRKRGRSPKMTYLQDLEENGFELEAEDAFLDEGIMIEEMLSELSDAAKKVIILRIIKGYSVEEVARQLGKPTGTIKSIQFRALEKLREGLVKGGFIQ